MKTLSNSEVFACHKNINRSKQASFNEMTGAKR